MHAHKPLGAFTHCMRAWKCLPQSAVLTHALLMPSQRKPPGSAAVTCTSCAASRPPSQYWSSRSHPQPAPTPGTHPVVMGI